MWISLSYLLNVLPRTPLIIKVNSVFHSFWFGNLQVNPNGKIPVENEQTSVPHIYAIGDCTSVDVLFHDAHWANPELTPVAVQVRLYLLARSGENRYHRYF